MTDVQKMLKNEIAHWVDKWIDRETNGMPRTARNQAIEEILSAYEDAQEWNEDVMTTGASVDEINNWLNNYPMDWDDETVEYILDQAWEQASLTKSQILKGLGFEMNAITDAFENCFATIEGVKEYAEKHGYDEDAEALDMDKDGFIDSVRETFMEELAAQGERLEAEDGLTDSIITACFDRASFLLEDTKVCQDLGVTFEGQANSYASNWLMECDEGTYSEFENEIGKIFDRLSEQRVEKSQAEPFENIIEYCSKILSNVQQLAEKHGYNIAEFADFDLNKEASARFGSYKGEEGGAYLEALANYLELCPLFGDYGLEADFSYDDEDDFGISVVARNTPYDIEMLEQVIKQVEAVNELETINTRLENGKAKDKPTVERD